MGGQDSGTLQDKTQAFLSEFFQRGESLVRELIEENDRLKSALDSATSGSAPAPTPGVPASIVERLMSKVDRLETECAEIRRIAGSVRRESGDYRERLDELEREHYHLAAVYVASNQFHAAVTVDEVVRTITEILLNFLGIGQFTIYCADEERGVMFPIAREGGDPEERAELPVAEAPLVAVMDAKRPWRTGDPLGAGSGALMHLPLVSADRVVGVARLESFLPQKSEFGENDHGLLELVSEHAGIAIEAAWVRAHASDTPMRRDAMEQLTGE